MILATLSPGSKAAPSWKCFFGDRYEQRACTFLKDLSQNAHESGEEWIGQFKGYSTCVFASLPGWKSIQSALGGPVENLLDRYKIETSKVLHDGPHKFGEDHLGYTHQAIAEIPLIEKSTGETQMTVRVSCETWTAGGLKRRSCDIVNVSSSKLQLAKETTDVCKSVFVSGLND